MMSPHKLCLSLRITDVPCIVLQTEGAVRDAVRTPYTARGGRGEAVPGVPPQPGPPHIAAVPGAGDRRHQRRLLRRRPVPQTAGAGRPVGRCLGVHTAAGGHTCLRHEEVSVL